MKRNCWHWKIKGSLCEGEVQGDWSEKMTTCARCEFFKLVQSEEGQDMAY